MVSVGSVVAGYVVERVLGVGGMGTVYLARNPTLPRRDALKVLSGELSRDRAFREWFVREADIASMLDHPNIVSIYSRGETDDGQLWIALQYVEGTDAEAALKAGEMTAHRAVHIVTEVAKALDFAHQRGVVHHDVKPANLLLSDDAGDEERVLLSDFGVARPIDDSGRGMDGAFTATLAYSAPEVITGEHIDGRADLYSLGCTLFRLLTGRQPFGDTDDAGTIRAHLEQPQPNLSDHLSWATAQLDAVIAKALAKDPAKRFGSAREFAAAAAEAVRAAAPPRVAPAPYRSAGSGETAPPAGPEFPPAAAVVPPRPPAPAPGPAPSSPPPGSAAGPQFGDVPEFRSTPRSGVQLSKPMVLGGAAVAVVAIVVAVVVVAVSGSNSSDAPAAATTTTVAADSAAQQRLMRLLPVGYPEGACTPQDTVPTGMVAGLSCGTNTDTGGPSSARYLLASDDEALQAAFDEVVSDSTTVVCPGGNQSPGAWRRNADLTRPVGMLYCGTQGADAVVAWTTDEDRLLSVAQSPRAGLPGLYRWWSTHS